MRQIADGHDNRKGAAEHSMAAKAGLASAGFYLFHYSDAAVIVH